MIESINEWMGKWEPIWLFIVLVVGLMYERYTAKMAKLEYDYDAAKDEAKRQRKTRTTKKTSESKDGTKTVEETTETSEPVREAKEEVNHVG